MLQKLDHATRLNSSITFGRSLVSLYKVHDPAYRAVLLLLTDELALRECSRLVFLLQKTEGSIRPNHMIHTARGLSIEDGSDFL